jgi:adenylosuccinate lyase
MSDSLNSVSPLDGRYATKTVEIQKYCSEGALIGYRMQVEAYWVRFLISEDIFGYEVSDRILQSIEDLTSDVPEDLIRRVKEFEKTTNHDVKAVEYALQERLKQAGAPQKVLALVHFACTSEDINNAAYGLMLKDLKTRVVLPTLSKVIVTLGRQVDAYGATAMLSRTHGQPATPSTMGKELAVFAARLLRVRTHVADQQILAKFNGAVGNFNAHRCAFPEVDWPDLSRRFIVQELGLVPNELTTQIESHDAVVEFFDLLRRASVISRGLCADVWSYISLGYFKLRVEETETGSSTMPHKVNPIDFENAEGNFGLLSSLAGHFAEKLPMSRLQRDLSDSTVMRNISTGIGYWFLAMNSMLKGLDKIEVDQQSLAKDLDQHFEIIAEAVQTVMRRHGIANAYERLKEVSRGQNFDKLVLEGLLNKTPELDQGTKEQILAITPQNYTGCAKELCESFLRQLQAEGLVP